MASDRCFGRVTAVLCLALATVRCVPSLRGPAAREVSRATPPAYVAEARSAESIEQVAATPVAQQAWSQFFNSAALRALIEHALGNNQELNIRLQELIIAYNEAQGRAGEYLPKVEGTVGLGVEKVGRYTSQGRADELTGVPKNLGNFAFGLVGSWEVDVWSKLRSAKKAADMRYFATVEGQRFLITQVVAEIARSYYELVAIDRQLTIVEENIRLQESTLEMVRLEKQAARVTELAVQRFVAELLRYKSRIAKLRQQRVQTENRLNFLVGRYPQPIERDVADFQVPPPTLVQAGMPTQLLENRTDVRQAELALAAAKLDVKSARAAFYPAVQIEAGVGYRAFNPAHLVATPASLFYNAVGGLVAPLINRKAIKARYESANAMQLQAVFAYEQTLLHAYTDVINQLAAGDNWRAMAELLAEETATLAKAVDTSSVLFQSARAEYIEVLTTRRDFLEAQLELVESQKHRFIAMVSVYQALGGGWRLDQVPSTPP